MIIELLFILLRDPNTTDSRSEELSKLTGRGQDIVRRINEQLQKNRREPMVASFKNESSSNIEFPAGFTVQVCSNDSRLLSEYLLTKKEHNVTTLAAAEQRALTNLSDIYDEQLIIVVSEETLTKLRQVQVKVVPRKVNPAAISATDYFVGQR